MHRHVWSNFKLPREKKGFLCSQFVKGKNSHMIDYLYDDMFMLIQIQKTWISYAIITTFVMAIFLVLSTNSIPFGTWFLSNSKKNKLCFPGFIWPVSILKWSANKQTQKADSFFFFGSTEQQNREKNCLREKPLFELQQKKILKRFFWFLENQSQNSNKLTCCEVS